MGFETTSYPVTPGDRTPRKDAQASKNEASNAQDRYYSQFYTQDAFKTFKDTKTHEIDSKKREALENKIFGRSKPKVTGNLDSSQMQN